MKIIIAKDYNDMSRKAANYLSAQIIMGYLDYWEKMERERQL